MHFTIKLGPSLSKKLQKNSGSFSNSGVINNSFSGSHSITGNIENNGLILNFGGSLDLNKINNNEIVLVSRATWPGGTISPFYHGGPPYSTTLQNNSLYAVGTNTVIGTFTPGTNSLNDVSGFGEGIHNYEGKFILNGCPLYATKIPIILDNDLIPDSDGDGVVNEEDDCPSIKGLAFLKGCPDGDGDGIADKDDKCPAVAGIKANNGCPEIPKEIVTQITKIASKIFFETGSDKLKSGSKTQLDDLADILSKYPEAKLSVEGHTDNTGNPEKNVQLSQKRCESVKNYLVSKGIDANRLSATGYGDTKPIADNKTADGRAKNRRVELKTQY